MEDEGMEIDDGLFNFFTEENEDAPEITGDTPEVKAEDDIVDPVEMLEDDEIEDIPEEIEEEVIEEIEEDPESQEEDSFSNVVETLSSFGVMAELNEEQNKELEGLEGEEKIERLLEIQKDIKDQQFYEEFDKMVDGLSPEFKKVFEYQNSGMSLKDAVNLANDNLSLDKISEDDLASDKGLQKDLITEYLRSNNTDPDLIDDLIGGYESKDKLLAVSKKALTFKKDQIIKAEQAQQEAVKRNEEAAVARRKQSELQYSNTIDSLDEIIPGIKVSAADKQAIKDGILKPIKTTNGVDNGVSIKRAENPIKFDAQIAYLVSKGMLGDGAKGWDKVVSNITTKQTTGLANKLRTTGSSFKATGTKRTRTSNAKINVIKDLDEMR